MPALDAVGEGGDDTALRCRGLIDGESRAQAAGISNLIERDVVLKEAMGFDGAHFTRLWQVLRRV